MPSFSTIIDHFQHYARHSVLIWKTMPAIPAVAKGYFKTLILKQPVLRTVEFTITADCNVDCEMCYASKIRQPGNKYLSVDEYRDIWHQAKKLGAFSAIISGGEPTTRKELFKILEAIESHKTIVALVSNSILLDTAFLLRLKDASVNVLHLSLNSVDPEENDRMRDFDNHFDRVCRIAKEAKAMGFEVCLSNVVSHNEIERSKKVAQFARDNELGVVFSLACPMGNWAGAQDILLTPEEWLEVDAFMHDNPYIRSDWTINLSLKRECPGGREKLCISPYGDVMGCGMNFISHGNVRQSPLEMVWRKMAEWPPFKKRSKECLISVDQDYLHNYLLPIADSQTLPVKVEEHPTSTGQKGREK